MDIDYIKKKNVSILCLDFFVTPVQIQRPSLYINQALLLYPLLKIQSISHAALEVKCG